MISVTCDKCGKLLDRKGAIHIMRIELADEDGYEVFQQNATHVRAELCWICAKKVAQFIKE